MTPRSVSDSEIPNRTAILNEHQLLKEYGRRDAFTKARAKGDLVVVATAPHNTASRNILVTPTRHVYA